MKKQLIAITLLLAMLLCVFGACGEDAKENESLSTPEVTDSITESDDSFESLEESVDTENISSEEESSEDEASQEEEEATTAQEFFAKNGGYASAGNVNIPACATATDTPHLYKLPIETPRSDGFSALVNGNLLFVFYWDESDLGALYSLETGELIKTVTMPFWYDKGVLNDGGFWIADKSNMEIVFYDKDGNDSLAYLGDPTLEDGEEYAISAISVSPDGKYALAARSDTNTLALVDIETSHVTEHDLELNVSVWDIKYNSRGFIACLSNDNYYVLDPITGNSEDIMLNTQYSLMGDLIDYSSSGYIVLGSLNSDQKLLMPMQDDEVLYDVKLGYAATYHILYDASVRFYNIASGTFISEISLASDAYGTIVQFNRDGSAMLIAPSAEGCEIYIYDVATAAAETENTPVEVTLLNNVDMALMTAEKVEQIYAKTGVELIYGAEGNDYITYDYVAHAETDPYKIFIAVVKIEDTLALYPQGMLKEAYEATHLGLRIYLCGTIYGVAGDSLSEAGAFVTDDGGYIILALDINEAVTVNLPHELSHVFDRRISYVSENGNVDWMTVWNDTAPGDDAYTFVYSDYENNKRYTAAWESDPANVWFIDGYSRVSPTEDRARIIENLFHKEISEYNGYFEYENIKNKAVLYSYILRQCFPSCNTNTTHYWEQGLGTVDDSVLDLFAQG